MTKNYMEIDFMAGSTIEDAVNELLLFKGQGELASGTFNGVTLYSDTVTMDGAYKEITGMTKAECDAAFNQRQENRSKKEKEHQDQVPELTKEWVEKGKAVLSEDKWDIWAEMVPIRLNDLYKGMELGAALAIIKILNNGGSLDEAKKEIDEQGHSGMSFGLVCSMVRDLCERGNEFVEYVNLIDLSEGNTMNIKQLSNDAKIKAYNDFVKWAGEMGHDNTHTLKEFIEISKVNNWEYNEHGDLV